MNRLRSTVFAICSPAATALFADELDKLKQYEYGQDQTSLLAVERQVEASLADRGKQAEMAKRLLEVMTDNGATLAAKQHAAIFLRICGTDAEVPALAAMLGQEKIGDFARGALERIPAAGAALRDALGEPKGVGLIGVINSVANRHDREAVGRLITLAEADDPQVAAAAVHALGRIGGPKATACLGRLAAANGGAATALAYLSCGTIALEAGDKKAAAAVFAALADAKYPAPVCRGALVGQLAVVDDPGALLAKWLDSGDAAARRVAADNLDKQPTEWLLAASQGKPLDRQVLAAGLDFDVQFHPPAGPTADRHARLGARRTARPTRSWLETRGAAGWMASAVRFIRRRATQRGVRTFAVVPALKVLELLPHPLPAERDHDRARAKRPQRQDESLNHGDTPVLSDSAVAGLDSAALAPALEAVAPEMRALVADEVLGSLARGVNRAARERTHGFACRRCLEDRHAHATSRVVIEGYRQPLVHHRDKTQPIDCPFGHVQRIVTGGAGGVANVHVVKITKGTPHVHTGYDEVYYVLAGTGTITLGQETHLLRPGSVAVIPAGVPHSLEAGPDKQLEFVIFGTPPMAMDDKRAKPAKPVG